jgi:hypothetical protein
VSCELRGLNVIERLDDLRRGQMRLQQLGCRRHFVIELRDVAITLRVVVVRVDDNLSRQRLDRNGPIVLQRDGDDDDVPGFRSIERRCRSSFGPELSDKIRQRLRSSRIADHHVVSALDREPRDLASNESCSDESNGLHNTTPSNNRLRDLRALRDLCG